MREGGSEGVREGGREGGREVWIGGEGEWKIKRKREERKVKEKRGGKDMNTMSTH